MTAWLLDTFFYTGILIAVVLVLRRPLARYFGAQTAYALWALPFLRLLLPPIVLPASLAPVSVPAASMAVGTGAHGSPVVMIVAEPAPLIGWSTLGLMIWLGGASAFLGWRVLTYRWMRQDLLDPARKVGEVGGVQLVETPEVSAPVAFGVLDKVIALPVLFMAQPDVAARDLAIAHELEHHRGRDLVANFAAQLLLALHWFNPLAWYGWRAMRHDQEAACDARVLAGKGREDRVRYAQLIAGTAAGQRLALVAPMACPVLGDASIIHRLRSLTMTDISPRRRWAGRALVAAGALALPLTASFSYAAQAQDAPVPSAPPQPPAIVAQPAAPAPPSGPQVRERRIERYATRGRDDGDRRDRSVRKVIIRRDGNALALAEPRFPFRGLEGVEDPTYRQQMEEWGRAMDEWSRKYGSKWGRDMGEWGRGFGEQQARRAQVIVRRNERLAERVKAMPELAISCDGKDGTSETTFPDGRRRVVICQHAVRGQALSGLQSARDRVANDAQLSDEVRRDVLQDLDREIERLKQDGED